MVDTGVRSPVGHARLHRGQRLDVRQSVQQLRQAEASAVQRARSISRSAATATSSPIAGRYNQDRNNFFGSLPLRWDANRVVGSGTGNRFPRNNDEREYDINYPLQQQAVFETRLRSACASRPDAANSCGTEFDRPLQPVEQRATSAATRSFTITDELTLTVDPSFQYTKANGGGTVDRS